jgi:hypothetical protein
VAPFDDDLSEFADEPVLRALTGPATPGELAGEAEALAAFRAAVPRRARRRYVSRLGVGGSALGIAVAMTGGVAAAAYSSSLPGSMQRPLNDWLGSIGVPAPNHHHHHHRAIVSATYHQPTPTAGPPATSSGVLSTGTPPAAGPSPHLSPTAKPKKPKHRSSPPAASLSATSSTPPSLSATPTPTPTDTPTPTPTPTPTDTPTPTPTPTPTDTPTPTPTDSPASITIAVSSTKIVAGGRVSVAAHLATAAGRPVRNHSIRLIEREAGHSEQHLITIGKTGSNGSVMLSTPPLDSTVLLRLATAQGFRSAAVKVVAAPIVSESVTSNGTSDTISAAVTGGAVGDVLELRERSHGSWFAVSTARLSSTSNATFSVTPPSTGSAHYRLVLRATQAHSSASTSFTIPSS